MCSLALPVWTLGVMWPCPVHGGPAQVPAAVALASKGTPSWHRVGIARPDKTRGRTCFLLPPPCLRLRPTRPGWFPGARCPQAQLFPPAGSTVPTTVSLPPPSTPVLASSPPLPPPDRCSPQVLPSPLPVCVLAQQNSISPGESPSRLPPLTLTVYTAHAT